MAKIFVIEDDDAIRNLVRLTLEMDEHTVIEAADGLSGIRQIEQLRKEASLPDLVLLDIMLPGMDGYEVCQKIQGDQVPVIFMTAKSSVMDKVFGLKLGADDYITKPFEPMELLARVEAHLRARSRYLDNREPEAKHRIQFGNLSVCPDERNVSLDGTVIPLTVKEYDLFLTFLDHLNCVLSREQLLDLVWGYDYLGGTRTVDMHVAQLRQKLNLHDTLETVYKIGYVLRGKKQVDT